MITKARDGEMRPFLNNIYYSIGEPRSYYRCLPIVVTPLAYLLYPLLTVKYTYPLGRDKLVVYRLGAKLILSLNPFISKLLGCQDPGGLLTGFDVPDRPERSWQEPSISWSS